MKRFSLAMMVVGLGIILLATSSAFAFDLGGYLGPVIFDLFDHGAGTFPEFDPGEYGNRDGEEDSWGIFEVALIRDSIGTILWGPSRAEGEELTGIYYGIDDDYWAPLEQEGGINIQSILGFVDVYLDSSLNYTPTGGPGVRTGLSSYPTATDGSLFLQLALVPGITFGDGNPLNDHITYSSFLFPGPRGFGAFYLDVIGGAYASMFDSNTFSLVDDRGRSHTPDMYASFTVRPGDYGWLVQSNDPISGHAVPEPGTLILLGTGFLGLAAIGRKRKR